ncbi:MAG: DUF433 domain-containing protein [Nevskiales bacterium]
MNWKGRIETDPETCGGRPRVKGTRLTVEFLLGLKAVGWTEAQILEGYPHITDDDLRAVFAFVQALIEEEKYVNFPEVA